MISVSNHIVPDTVPLKGKRLLDDRVAALRVAAEKKEEGSGVEV